MAFAALLVGAAAWAYSTSFAGVLVLDDVRAIARNQTIRSLWPPTGPLSPPAASTVSGRPVANLSLAINYAVAPPDARDTFAPGGPEASAGTAERFLRNVWGYHFLNLVIHAAAGLTLFGIIRRTLMTERLRGRFESSATGLAFVGAALWLVHPLHTESVTYIVQRVESLMGLFYLLTLYCAIRARDGKRAWVAAAVVCCALGMATKEAMVTAPIMVCLWDWSFGAPGDTRRRWPLLAGLAATWVILFALVVHEHRAPSVELGQEMTWRYLLTQAGVVTHYLRLAVVPSPLVFLYTWPMISSLGAVALQAALLTALVVLAVNGVLRRHPLGFAGAWFLLILAPTSSVLPIVTEVAAEHRMYLPLAALVVSAVAGATFAGQALMARVTAREEGKSSLGIAVCALLTVALVVAYGTETRARNRDYWSEERLWQDTVAKQPANQRARVAYGTVLATARRYAEAEVQFRAAVDLAPTDPLAPVRLGSMQAAQGRLDEAIPHFEQALSVRPDDIDAHRFLGEAYAIRRQDALAVAHLQRALAVLPDDATRLTRLAAILTHSRDPSVRDGAKAVDLAEQAVRLTARQDPWPLEVLSAALASVGRYADAAATVNEALWVARAQGNEQLISELEYRAAAYRARQ